MASKAPWKKKSIDFSKSVGNVLDPYQMTEAERQVRTAHLLYQVVHTNALSAIYIESV
jgi:hypothetical protein